MTDPSPAPLTDGIFTLGGRSLHALRRGLFSRPELRRSLAEMLFGNVPLTLLSLAAFGVVLVEHAAIQSRHSRLGLTLAGPPLVELMLREFGPIWVGLMFTMRSGAGIAAELAYMAQTEQLDALQLSSVDPVAELVAPRLLAGLICLPILGVAGALTGALAAAGWAAVAHHVDPIQFLSLREVQGADWLSLALKTLSIGVAVPWAACHAAISLGGRPEGVGRAVVAAVVAGSVLVITLDVAVSGVLWPLL